jgi:magnesium transporter
MLIQEGLDTQYGAAVLLEQWKKNEKAFLWLDIVAHESTEERDLLKSLNCHLLAIDQALRERHSPKVQLFDDYIFMLYRGVYEVKGELQFEHLQISLFVGTRILITRHPKESQSINTLFNKEGEKYLKRSPVILALRIFNLSCGIYLEELLSFEETLEVIEDAFQVSGDDKMMQELTLYRSHLVKLKRTFNYHLNIGAELKMLVDDETILINQADLHTLTDVQERLERSLSLSQMYYDICGDIVNGYISISSHQLNATMRLLTVITAIFIPLGFLAGIYGMNFEYMPELKVEKGYFYLIGTMAAIAASLVVFFKKKKWL